MSMNIAICAKRDVLVVKTGNLEAQILEFHALQTPTEVSYKIIEAPYPLQAYKDWVRDTVQDVEEPIYAEDDIFCTEDPIGITTYNMGAEHLAELDGWISHVEDIGYTVYLEIR